MTDAAWGFWGSVIGSLIGGAIAYFVALQTARAQMKAVREIEEAKQARNAALAFFDSIDEFVLLSFRGATEDRQKAARKLLTATMICDVEKFALIEEWVKKVDRYHHAKKNNTARGITFDQVRQTFDGIKAAITQKHFGRTMPQFEEKASSQELVQ